MRVAFLIVWTRGEEEVGLVRRRRMLRDERAQSQTVCVSKIPVLAS